MNKDKIIAKIKEVHGNDLDQINFIQSEEKKLIVTASAGCGKTKSMISKIAFELASKPNMNFKKILALTFSVNAATKIKEDTKVVMPLILDNLYINIDKKLDVSNYHSFSIKLIYKHGYTIHSKLKGVDDFTIIPETDSVLNRYLSSSELSILKDYHNSINEIHVEEADRLEDHYINIMINRLISNEIITYNGLMLLAIKLLNIETVRKYYEVYYPLIIVDEFQDTNYLAYKLISRLISNDNKVILMGDDIQKIYGFLGAIPGLFNRMQKEYNMIPMEFKTNYRFSNNIKMKNLDFYLRGIFRNYENMDSFDLRAEINLGFYKTDSAEASSIVNNILDKVSSRNKVALLVRGRNNANNVINKLERDGIKYFNGLFSDADTLYNHFHKVALDKFIIKSGPGKIISRRILDKVITDVEQNKISIATDDVVFNSLMRLLKALFDSARNSNLSKEEKYNKIIFVLNNNSLKRLMNEIDENLILTTIHGSKGLEWDYVYIPEITKSQFPHYRALCKHCISSNSGIQYEHHCEFKFPKNLQEDFEEELSLFYVGITRAKKDVFLFANVETNQFGYPQKRSCFTALPNLVLNRHF